MTRHTDRFSSVLIFSVYKKINCILKWISHDCSRTRFRHNFSFQTNVGIFLKCNLILNDNKFIFLILLKADENEKMSKFYDIEFVFLWFILIWMLRFHDTILWQVIIPWSKWKRKKNYKFDSKFKYKDPIVSKNRKMKQLSF